MHFATIRMRSVDQPWKDAISKVSKFLCTHRLNQSSIELLLLKELRRQEAH